MPTVRGVVRRPNMGRGQTVTTSVSFSKADKLWVEEQTVLRNISFSLVIAEALDLYRQELRRRVTEVEREEKGRAILAGKDAAKKRAGAATSTAPGEPPVEL